MLVCLDSKFWSKMYSESDVSFTDKNNSTKGKFFILNLSPKGRLFEQLVELIECDSLGDQESERN